MFILVCSCCVNLVDVRRAPETLLLHLKRFQQDLSGRLRKIDGPVPFPPELDLSPFCDPEVSSN